MCSEQNRETIEAYNSELGRYISHTPQDYNKSHVPLLRWLNAAMDMIPTHGTRILEIGSGTGRDAMFMKGHGYTVDCSDAASSFVDYLRQQDIPAFQLDILRDSIEKKYEMIIANAVVPHFTDQDLRVALGNIRGALTDQGLFALSAKQGKGETWTQEKLGKKRYIRYWKPQMLREMLGSYGFEIVYIETDTRGDLNTHIWTHIIARKA